MTNDVLPIVRGLTWSVIRTAEFANQEMKSASKKRVRVRNAVYPLWHFELTWEYLKDNPQDIDEAKTAFTDLETILGFFCLRSGSFESFRFRLSDATGKASDSHADGQLLGVGDGANRNFQLVQTSGGFTDKVTDVVSLKVRVAGIETAAYTLAQNGMLTLTVAPANGQRVDADFDFFHRVTFEEDIADFENFQYQLYTLQNVKLATDKL